VGCIQLAQNTVKWRAKMVSYCEVANEISGPKTGVFPLPAKKTLGYRK